jgi:hypothetical protein
VAAREVLAQPLVGRPARLAVLAACERRQPPEARGGMDGGAHGAAAQRVAQPEAGVRKAARDRVAVVSDHRGDLGVGQLA